MWIELEKTYSGPLGLFVVGQSYDVPENIAKGLPKGTWKKCKAPWEANVDEAAVRLNKARADVEAAKNLCKEASLAYSCAKPAAEYANCFFEKVEAKAKVARTTAVNAVKAAKTAEAKAEAEDLLFEAEIEAAKAKITEAETQQITVAANLRKLMVEYAQRKLQKAEAELKKLLPAKKRD